MKQWEFINKITSSERENFKKSYICISKNIYERPETVWKHLNIIISSLESIRKIMRKCKEKCTAIHMKATLEICWILRDQLVKTLDKDN